MADNDKVNIIPALKFLAVLPVLVASAVLSATHAQAPNISELSTTQRPMVANCAKAPPDAEYFIPENLIQHIVPSGSGAYGYRTGCSLWVVDFSLNSKSNTYVIPSGQRFKEKTVFYGVPHDLPSSLSAGGENPIVKEDCERLRVEHYIYSKFKHEPKFIFRKHLTRKGEWLGSQNGCKLTKDPGTPPDSFRVEAPDANVLVIRVATRVKLRTSWQEAAAKIHDIPHQ